MATIKINSDRTKCRRVIDIDNGPEINHWEDRYTFPADLITLEWVDGDKPSLVHVEGTRRLKSGQLGVQRVGQAYSFTNPGPVWPAVPRWVLDTLNNQKAATA